VKVIAESVPVMKWTADDQMVEERRAGKGEQFKNVQITTVMSQTVGGEYWMMGQYDEARKWEDVRFLPVDGIMIVSEQRRPDY